MIILSFSHFKEEEIKPQPTFRSTEDSTLGSAHYKPRPPMLPLGLLQV